MAVERSPRIRPWLRRFAIVAFTILVPVALFTLWDYVEARRLAAIVREIHGKGEPVNLWRPHEPMAPADAGARYYDAAAALVDSTGAFGARGIFNRFDNDKADRTLLHDVREFLDRNREAEAMLARATDAPFATSQAGFEYNYRLSRLFALARLAQMRAFERLENNDVEQAVAAILQQLRLARPLGWSTTRGYTDLSDAFSGLVVVNTCADVPRVLERAPAAALDQLQRALQESDVESAVEQALLSDRAFYLQTYWNDASQWYAKPSQVFNMPPPPAFYVLRPWIVHRFITQVNTMTALLAVARQPWPARLRVDVPPDVPVVPGSEGRLRWWQYPSAESIRVLHKRRTENVAARLALLRAATIATAIERYRDRHDGSLPTSLADLAPAFLGSIPIDPYSGKPLRYVPHPDRYIVYSLGPDERDDGGVSLKQRLTGRPKALPPDTSPFDIGFEVRISR
jgi:hypothetical protein